MPTDAANSGRHPELNPADIPVGVIGVGLMGTSIVSCLLASGHPVVGVESSGEQRRRAPEEVRVQLEELIREGFLDSSSSELLDHFQITNDITNLEGSRLVVECIAEDIDAKRHTFNALEQIIPPTAVIGSNTSAIPLSLLQQGMRHPERLLGIHWTEPAHVGRFLEIILGEETAPEYVEYVSELARLWSKEPTLVRRDIRGFITNRISYAMFREACHLVESGIASIEDVDRSLRNDVGYWITFAGPFRYMDLMGVPAYEKVMRDLLPELNSSPEVPLLMKATVESGAKGISNCRGFYEYTPEEAERWKELFHQFTFEIHRLAQRYPDEAARITETKTSVKDTK
jgi:3-hydroxybutyryl-CoA dehydrogenase